MEPIPSRTRRLAAPLLFGTALLVLAPFMGTLLDALKRTTPGQLERVFVGVLVLAGVAIVVGAVRFVLRRPRDLVPRLALVVAGLGIAIAFFVHEDRGAMVSAQERLHFVLYGLLCWLFYRAYRPRHESWGSLLVPVTVLSTVAFGLLDEAVQAVVMMRTGEIYDVGLNTLATVCGMLVVLGIEGWPPSQEAPLPTPTVRSFAALLITVAVVFGAFFHYAHLGYRIEDPEIGIFYSYTHPERFDEVNRDRDRRWSTTTPGPPFGPLELNDRFRVEAGWRTQHRNAQYHEGHAWPAFQENLILERYFPSFLEHGNRRGDDYRLPPEQRRDLERQLPGTPPGVYVSPAGIVPKRIFARPSKTVFWLLVVLFCAGVAFSAFRRGTARH